MIPVGYWLGREDSNLRMRVPKTRVLPLDDAPVALQRSLNREEFQPRWVRL